MVRVTIHGGLNEIGGNKLLVEDGEDRIYLDFGTPLGTRNKYFAEFLNPRTNTSLTDLLRLDLLPHVDGIYREDLTQLAWDKLDDEPPESAKQYRERTGEGFLDGILITHAHLDHFGDVAYLDPEIPVYCTATTRSMLEAIQAITRTTLEGEIMHIRERSLAELGGNATFPGELKVDKDEREREIHVCPEKGTFNVAGFQIQAIPVDHSVPGAVAYHVETPSGKTLFYTGDIRFHGRLTDRTRTLREHAEDLQPDILLSEGTRMMDDAGESEESVETDLERLIRETDGLAITEFAWKDTTRFDTLQRVADATGRTLVINPKLAYLLRRLAHRHDVPSNAVDHYDNVAVYLHRHGTMRYRPSDYVRAKTDAGYQADWDTQALRAAYKQDDDVTLREPLAHVNNGIRATDIRENPDAYIVQLSFWDIPALIDLDPPPGSRWIRCLTEPYSDEMELDLERQENWMNAFNLEHNITPNGGLAGLTHVSGHAAGTDLKPFIEAINADTLIPIHTEPESLPAFEGLADQVETFPSMDHQDAAHGKAIVEL